MLSEFIQKIWDKLTPAKLIAHIILFIIGLSMISLINFIPTQLYFGIVLCGFVFLFGEVLYLCE